MKWLEASLEDYVAILKHGDRSHVRKHNVFVYRKICLSLYERLARKGGLRPPFLASKFSTASPCARFARLCRAVRGCAPRSERGCAARDAAVPRGYGVVLTLTRQHFPWLMTADAVIRLALPRVEPHTQPHNHIHYALIILTRVEI